MAGTYVKESLVRREGGSRADVFALMGIALVVMLFAIYLPVIRDEEAFLRQKFPEFEEYSRRVPRIVPWILRRGDGESGGFSFDLYRKHREYNALLGTVLLTGALILKMTLLS